MTGNQQLERFINTGFWVFMSLAIGVFILSLSGIIWTNYYSPDVRCRKAGYMSTYKWKGRVYCAHPYPAPPPDAVLLP